MSLQGKVFKLANGNTIPAIGFGVGTHWFKGLEPKATVQATVDIVATAIKTGFTHIDGAQVYGTAKEVGLGIKQSGAKREDLFLTHKHFSGGVTYESFSKDAPYDELTKALKEYQVDYVDLYLLHSPNIKKETHGYTLEEGWKQVERLRDEGLAKNIGVSNFSKEHLETIFNSSPKYKPQVNQIEFHAYLQNVYPDVVEFSKKNDILVEAYGPLVPITTAAPGPIDDVVAELAKKYGKTETQVLLRWVLDNGILPLTTSSKESRIKDALGVLEFKLDPEDVKKITTAGSSKTFRKFKTL